MNSPALPNDAPHSDDSSALPDPLAEPKLIRHIGPLSRRQWERLMAERAKMFSPPPLDATPEEEAEHDRQVDELNSRPGQFVPYQLWEDEHGVRFRKERFIADEDLAAMTGEKPSLGSIPKEARSASKTADLGSIPRNRGKPAKSASKSGKLSVSKSGSKRDSWTVTADDKTTFRIRLTESGYSIVLRWREPDGKRPERYCCYLSKSEWSKAKQGSLSAFAQTVAQKVDARIASGEGGSTGLADVLRRIRAFT